MSKFGPNTTAINISDVIPRAFHQIGGDSQSLDDSGNLRTLFEEGWSKVWKRLASLGAHPDSASRLRDALWKDITSNIKRCESPIERVMLTALMVSDYPGSHLIPMVLHVPKEEAVMPASECVLIPQFAFAKYRMDFGLVVRRNKRQLIIDIECDGAEYHKDKVSDRARDDYLRSWGIPIFRFSGKEIYSHPFACADKVVSHIMKWAGHGADS